MSKTLHLLLVCIAVSFSATAQFFCGNDFLDKKSPAETGRCALLKAKDAQAWANYNRALSLSKMVISAGDTSFEIPTVIHIIHTGGAIGTTYNPSDAEIDNFMNFINKTWSATWPSYLNVAQGGTNMKTKFVLAKRDPNCSATTGINRVDGSILSGYSTYGICPGGSAPGPSDREVKELSLWPVQDYYNIWLVCNIEDGKLGGYAPWPWYTSADLIDGAVVLTQYARPTSGTEFYMAAPHEIGHSFGLYHTFQDGCDDATGNCLLDGDQLCDTEPHVFTTFDCEHGEFNSCTGKLFDSVEYNFMNYSTCPGRFTKDQKNRTRFTIKNYRMGLVNSLGANAPDAGFIAPKMACTPSILNPSSDQEIGPCNINFANLYTSSSGYNSDRATYLDRTCVQGAANVLQGNSYSIDVATKTTPQSVKVWIDYNNDGVFQTTEMVFSHTGLSAEEVHRGTVAIPATGVVTATNLRMRVKSDIGIIVDACSNVAYGQTEDYTVIAMEASDIKNISATNAFRIYPNPASEKVTVEGAANAIISIYSIDGKLMSQQTNASEINIANLAAGVYFVYAQDAASGARIGVQKLIKTEQ